MRKISDPALEIEAACSQRGTIKSGVRRRDTGRPKKGENQRTTNQGHDENILGDTRSRESAGDKGERRQQNIREPAYYSQASSRATVSAMKKVQGTDQRYRHARTEEPEPESHTRC